MHGPALSLKHTHTHSLSLSLSNIHTNTHTLSLKHAHTLSLSLSNTHTHTSLIVCGVYFEEGGGVDEVKRDARKVHGPADEARAPQAHAQV